MMSTPRPHAADGFTLVEVLVVAVLVSLFTGTLFVLASTGHQAWARTDAQLANLTTVQKALDRLGEDLRVASGASATLKCDPNRSSIQFDQGQDQGLTRVTYQRLGSQLVVSKQLYAELPNDQGGGQDQGGGMGGRVVFQQANVGTGGTYGLPQVQVIANGVTNFAPTCHRDPVTHQPDGVVQVNVAVQTNAVGRRGTLTRTLSSQFRAANP